MTLTGPGGVGKTRLAVAVGERLRDRFGAGTAFVPLESVTDSGQVLAAIGRAAGTDLAGVGAPVEALAETFGDGAWLLVLDNLEQVVQVAPDLGELLGPLPGGGDAGHQPHGAGAARRAGVPGAAAGVAGRSGHRLGRGGGGLAGGGAVRGPGPRGAPRLCPHRGQRGGGDGDLPAAGGACRWRSSWPPPAPGCWTRPRCWTGWRPRWTRSAPARWISPSGSGPCAPPWSGASASGRRRAFAAGGHGGVHRRLDHPGRRPGGGPG